jgi:hypothetical protein
MTRVHAGYTTAHVTLSASDVRRIIAATTEGELDAILARLQRGCDDVTACEIGEGFGNAVDDLRARAGVRSLWAIPAEPVPERAPDAPRTKTQWRKNGRTVIAGAPTVGTNGDGDPEYAITSTRVVAECAVPCPTCAKRRQLVSGGLLCHACGTTNPLDE